MNEFHHILQTLPTDPASLFALGLTAVAVIFIVIVGRGEKTDDETAEQTHTPHTSR